MTALRLGVAFSALLLAARLDADEWPRFRGPNGAGRSDSTLPVSWTPDANVAWKVTLPGAGVSSPIVVNDRVFVTCYSGYGLDRENPGDINNLKRHLVCLDAGSGEKLWQKDFEAVQPEDPFSGIGVTAHGYASHTPVSDGQRVYVYFGKSGAFAFDLDGNQLWQKNLGTESDPWKWGSAASPIVFENLVIVTASAESQAIVGLDAKTGEEVWRQEAAGLDGMWGTPAIIEAGGRTDLVMSVPKEMWGLDPSTGNLRWYCEATGAEQAHSSPITGGGMVFAFTGRGGGSVAVRAGGDGDVTDSNVVWTGRDSARFGSPVGHKTNLFLVANGVLSVIDGKTGKRTKQTRLQGGGSGGGRSFGGSLDYASPVIAGDNLYYVNGKGETFVFTLGADPEQVSINLVTTDSETFGGTPAISNNRMYLRSNKHLYCVADSGANVRPNASANLIAKANPGQEAGGGDRRRGRGGRGGPGGGFGGGRGGPRGGFDPSAIFSRRDSNNDEKLTLDEVEGSPIADRFAEIDKDGDEAITMQEFRDGMRGMFRGGGRGGPGRGGRGGRGGFGGPEREDNRPKRAQRPQSAT